MAMNRVIIMGNITRDIQIRQAGSTSLAEFGIASNRKYKTAGGEQREEVCFVDCQAWGKTGEIINQYFSKGKPILIEGRLKFDSWEDKNGGGKRSKLTIDVENFNFVGGDRDEEKKPASKPAAGKPQLKGKKPASDPIGDDTFSDSDIPF